MLTTLRLLATVLCVFVFTFSNAQSTNTIKGTITDDLNNFVENAQVSVKGTEFKATSGLNGSFEIVAVPNGTYELEITAPDHLPYSKSFVLSGNGIDFSFIVMETSSGLSDDNRDNIPVASISDSEVRESSTQAVSGVLSASRDAFVSATTNTFGAARFRIRGYENENFVTYMNGVPMTDLFNGNSMFYLWGGLNDVTRNRETINNLWPSTFSFGGVGGSSQIDSRASKQRKQLAVSYALSNRAYENRVMATYGTGLMKGGWAFAGSLSRRWSDEGYIAGTYYDGWGYFLAAEKLIGFNHSISLTSFGAPVERGKSSPAMKELYELAGTNYYNPTWGWQEGKKRNASVNISHQPVIILAHDWKINNQSNLRTGVGYTFGENINTALDWYNAPDPRPDYYRNLPSYYSEFPDVAQQLTSLFEANDSLLQIQWDELYNANLNSIETIEDADGIVGNSVTGRRSHYIIEERVADGKKLHINTTYNTSFSDNFQFSAGGGIMDQRTNYFKRVKDLLGGDFYVDINQYAEQDFADSLNFIQNDVNRPNRILREGDRFGYDYDANIFKGNFWSQGQWKFEKIDFFASVELSQTSYYRTGNVTNGLFQDNSFGDSEKQQFTNYAAKGGMTYKIDGRNYLFANAASMTRAPYFENAFVSARTRNQTAPGLTNEKVMSFEGGYLLRAPRTKGRAVFYYTQFSDQTNTVSFYHSDYRNFVNYTLTNVDKRHTGVELAIDHNFGSGFSANAVAAIGQYYYTDRPLATITVDNTSTTLVDGETVYAKNFYVGGTPQSAYTIGLNYRAKKFWFVNLNFNYFDNTYLDFNPARRTAAAIDLVPEGSEQWNSILNQQKTDGQFTVDFFGGKSWKLNDKFKAIKRNTFLVLNAGVSNITNNTSLVTGGFEQLRFDFTEKNPDAFAPKYFYSFGTTYFINLILRIN
ncbi:MAG: hypothetical protein RL090_447 [Bacteroidota bacterium]|jgi:hypothetical protein